MNILSVLLSQCLPCPSTIQSFLRPGQRWIREGSGPMISVSNATSVSTEHITSLNSQVELTSLTINAIWFNIFYNKRAGDAAPSRSSLDTYLKVFLTSGVSSLNTMPTSIPTYFLVRRNQAKLPLVDLNAQILTDMEK